MRDQARFMNMIQSSALNSFKDRQRQNMLDSERKRMIGNSSVGQEGGPQQKKRRLGFPACGTSAPLGNNWWRYGEIQKEIIQTFVKQKSEDPATTGDSLRSSAQTESSHETDTPSATTRVVSTDSLFQPAQQREQEVNGGVPNIQSLQLKSASSPQVMQQPISFGNATFSTAQLGQRGLSGMPLAFFRGGSDYSNTATNSGFDADIDDDCSEDSSCIKFRAYQAENWTEKFEELIEFRAHFGHCLVPNAFAENPALAQWVKRQRYQYKLKTEGKRSTMSDERVTALEEIGFVWDSHAAIWDERLQELLDYEQVNGHCNVPSRYAQNRQLAVWVKRQRRQYKFYCDGQPSSMTEQRIVRLNAIGFEWDLRQKK